MKALSLIYLCLTLLWSTMPLLVWPQGPDQYIEIKWFAFYLGTLVCLLLFVTFKKLKSYANFNTIGYRLAATSLGLGLLLSGVLNWPTHGFEVLFQLFCSASLLMVLLLSPESLATKSSCFMRLFARGNLLALTVVTCIGFSQAFGFRPLETFSPVLFWRNEFPSSTFGFQNMTAEFIALALCVIMVEFTNRKKKSRVWNAFNGLALLAGLFYLVLLSSRSTAIAIAIATASLLLFRHLFEGVGWKRLLLVASPVFLSSLFIAQNVGRDVLVFMEGLADSGKVNSHLLVVPKAEMLSSEGREEKESSDSVLSRLSDVKKTNTKIRFVRWANTLQMVAARPLGFGPNGFSYNYLDFRNAYASDSEAGNGFMPYNPHNGYLEFLVEYGFIALLGLICLVLILIKDVASNLWKSKPELLSETSASADLLCLSVALLSFLSVDAFFAFPMELPIPQFMATIALWPILELLGETKLKLIGAGFVKRLAYIAIGLVAIGGLLFGLLTSTPISGRFKTIHSALFCRLVPEKWEVCLQAAHMQWVFGMREEAIALIELPLNAKSGVYPLLLQALDYRLQIPLTEPNRQKICQLRARYLEVTGSGLQSLNTEKLTGIACDKISL